MCERMTVWPKLSQQLTGPKHPEKCQRCGLESFSANLSRWREHDANDSRTPIVIVLCEPCGDAVIEKHPRLYARLGDNQPDPGSMALCVDCSHREGTACNHHDLIANGGKGLMMAVAAPTKVHVHAIQRSRSGWARVWPYSPRYCAGKEPVGEVVSPGATVFGFVSPEELS